MRIGAIIGAIVGLVLSIWLLESYGVERIFGLLADAGWFGLGAVIAFHIVQIVFSAAGWLVITPPVSNRPSLGGFMILRWIREGVNNLLPVAQIGGEFVVTRLLRQRGMALAPAIAGTVADLTMEMLTQIAFTLLGLGLLLHLVSDGGGLVAYVTSGLVTAGLVAVGFLGAQWLGLATAIEKGLVRLGRAMGWSGMGEVEGLHAALIGCYRRPKRVLLAALWQMVSWMLGGFEVCLALHFLGHDIGLAEGLVIESLGQALKAVGFAVPGALGVQEGGLIVVCQLFGLAPEVAIALSLMKRLREIVLGVPGLLAWQYFEARGRAAPVPPISGTL